MPDTFGGYASGLGEYAGPPVANSPLVSVAGGLFPTTLLEIAPGYGPNDAAPVWVNIAADVTQISSKRGRQRILGRFEAGTMTITVDNKSGRYSPFNSSSPYYNLIVPGMPIRWRALWGAVTYNEFSGFVESWPLVWPSAADSTVTITAVDAMKFLNLKKATAINTYSQTVSPDAPYLWYRANDAIGATTMADSGSAGLTLGILYRTGYPHLAGEPDAVLVNPTFQAEGALVGDTNAAIDFGEYASAMFTGVLPASITAATAVTIEAWMKTSKQQNDTRSFIVGVTSNPTSTAVGLTIGPNGTAQLALWDTTVTDIPSPARITDGKWHHVVGTTNGTTGLLYVDGLQVASGSQSAASFAYTDMMLGGRLIPATNPETVGLLDEVAVYRKVLTPAQIATHYLAGAFPRQLETTGQRIGYLASYSSIPTTQQLLDTGAATVQGATAKWLTGTILANMQDQADTEGLYAALFIDAAGRLTFFDRTHTSKSPYSSVSLILGDSGTPPEEPYRLDSLTVSYDDQDVYNEIVITPDGMAPQTASDSTSQTTYGKRTQSLASLTSSVSDAASQAAARLALFKTPVPRVESVTVVPTDDPTMLFGPVLGSDLLTKIEVLRRPKDGAGSTFDQSSFIEGIEHKVTKASWQTTWRLGPV